MAVKFANLASTTLSSAITNSATSVAVADASLFPTLGSGDYFYATIGEGGGSEIVKVTAISSNTLTVTRAQDGTTASAFSSGETIALRVVAAALDDIASQAQSAADTESVSIDGDTMTGNLNMGDNDITDVNNVQFDTGVKLRDATDSQIHLQSNNANAVAIEFKTSDTTRRGVLYANASNEIGILDSDYNWAIRHTRDNRTDFFVNDVLKGRLDSNKFEHVSSVRSPVFYSSTNTTYYLYPANTGTALKVAGTMQGKALKVEANSAAAAINIKRTNTGSGGAKGYIAFRDVNDYAVASIASIATGGDNNGTLRFQTSAGASQSDAYSLSTALTLDTSQNATFTGSVNVGGDLNIASTIAHTGDLDTYFQFNAANTARIVVGGSQKFVVNTNGVSINNGTLNMTSNNITSAGTISSGAITSTGVSSFGSGTTIGNIELDGSAIGNQEAGIVFQPNSSYRCIHPVSMTATAHTSDISLGWSNNKWKDIYLAGYVKADSGYQVGTTTVIDSSRNITAGTISGTLVSSVTATTQTASDNSTKVATTAYVDSAVSGLVGSAPTALDTLNELASALGNDANFSTTVTNSIATKLPKSGGTMTGNLTIDYTGHQTGDAGLLVTNDASDWGIKVDKDGTADYGILSQTDGENAIVVRNAAGTNKIQLQGDGDATFEGGITVNNNSTVTGSGSSGNAFHIYRGSDGAGTLRVLNTGEVVVSNNYFYVDASQGAYFNGEVRVRGGISNDGSNYGGDVRIHENLSISGDATLNKTDGFMYLSNIGTGNSGIYVRGIGGSNILRSHSTGSFRWEVNGAEEMALTTNYLNVNGYVRGDNFSDRNDTAYYVDPASVSNMHDITFNGVIRSTNNANVDGANFNVSTTNKSTSEYAYRVDRSGTVVGGIRINGSMVAAGLTTQGITNTGSLNMSNQQIYGVNNLRFNDAGVNEGIKWDGGNQWQIYESPNSQTNAAGNLQFTSGSGNGSRRLTIDTSGHVTATGSSRSPIFYDSDNTGYYLNPSSDSHINELWVDDYLAHNGDGDTYLVFDNDRIRLFAGGAVKLDTNRGTTVYENSGTKSSGDFDNFTDGGNYVISNHANISNSPPNSYAYGLLRVTQLSGTSIVSQEYIPHSSGEGTFIRFYWSPHGWTSWRESVTFSSDGTGTGLDADLLDGHDSGSFLRSNVTDNYTSGTLSFNSGTALKMLAGSNFDTSSGDVYANMRVIRNNGTANLDGMYIGYANANSGVTRLFGGGATNNGVYVYSNYSQIYGSTRSPIYYDSDNTSYYVDPASTSQIRKTNIIASGSGWDDGLNLYSSDANNRWNLLVDNGDSDAFRIAYNNSQRMRFDTNGTVLINGVLNVSNPSTAYSFTQNRDSTVKVAYPDGGAMNLNGSNTGAIKIRMPQSWTNTMFMMTVAVYDYSSHESFEVKLGGYNHTSGNLSGGSWHSVFAWIDSSHRVARDFTVRFGHDGTKCCIQIGETNSTWSYLKVAVTEFFGTHSNTSASQWYNGWDVSLVTTNIPTSGGGTSISQTDSNRYMSIMYDRDNTGYLIDPAGTSRTNQTHADYIGIGAANNTSGSYRLNMGGSIDMNNNHVHYINEAHFNGGSRFKSDGAEGLILRSGSGSASKIRLGTNSDTARGYVYANSSNQVGFLDSDHAWAIRHVRDNRTDFLVNNTVYGVLNADYFSHTSDIRAPIFYDSDDTAYYVNPATGSKFLNVGIARDPRTDSYRLSMGGHIHMNNNEINYLNQIHFNDNVRFYDDGNDSYLNFKWGDTGAGGIKFRDGDNNVEGYVYGDAGMFGTLSSDGTWALSSWNGGTYIYHSARSPIYYDMDDTSYYVNPNSTSVVSSLDVQSGSHFRGANQYFYSNGNPASSSSPALQAYANATTSGAWMSFHRPGQYAINWGLNTSNDMYLGGWSQTGYRMYIDTSSHMFVTGSVRAPIFYDKANTAYYVDPASTSRLHSIWCRGSNANSAPRWDTSFHVVQSQHFYAHTSSQDMYLGESGNHTRVRGTMRVGNDGGAIHQLYVYGVGQASASWRAPLFYDSNNTAYYLHPDGTSNLNTVRAASNFELASGHGKGLRFWQSDNYKIYMSSTGDSTWGGRVNNETTSDYNMYFRMKGGTNRGFVFRNNTNNVAGIDASGNFRAEGNVIAYASSDRKLKDNIAPIENALDKVCALNGYTFNWNDKQTIHPVGKADVGVIAQEVIEQFPEVCREKTTAEGDTHLGVDYERLVPALIGAIRELKDEIESLKEKIK